MLIRKKPISFEIFCLKKYSHGKDSKKLTQIYKMIKLSFCHGITASLLNLAEDSPEMYLWKKLSKKTEFLMQLLVTFLRTKSAFLSVSFLSKQTIVE